MPSKEDLETQLQDAADAWEAGEGRKMSRSERAEGRRYAREREAEVQSKEARARAEMRRAKGKSKSKSKALRIGSFSMPKLSGNPKRIVLAELVGSAVLVTVASYADGGDGPAPGDFVPLLIVYMVLFFASEFGTDSARVAAAFGGLVMLAIIMAHGEQISTAIAAVVQISAPAKQPPKAKGSGGRKDGRQSEGRPAAGKRPPAEPAAVTGRNRSGRRHRSK